MTEEERERARQWKRIWRQNKAQGKRQRDHGLPETLRSISKVDWGNNKRKPDWLLAGKLNLE